MNYLCIRASCLFQLFAAGFTHIHGLDGSTEMLNVSRSKGVYRELIHSLVAIGDGHVDIPDGEFIVLIKI